MEDEQLRDPSQDREYKVNPIDFDMILVKLGKNGKRRIIKNVLVISLAFMLHFTAFHGTANLQSSVNEAGTYTLLSIYFSLMIACIFLPVLVIRYLGCKWTMAVSFLAYMPFVGAQFYPRAFTLIPAGLAVGLGGAALWCAKCTYLTIVAEAFSALTKNKIESQLLVVRFLGVFFVFYQTAQIWGNLISSSVLSVGSSPPSHEINSTSYANIAEVCGANFCPGLTATENPYLVKPDPKDINLLSAIFLGCIAGAVLLVALGVDSTKRYDLGRKGSGGGLTGFKLLSVTAKQLLKPYQLLLVPVIIFIGFDHAIINADLTSAFIACGWGISNIGYAMVCFGIANALGSAVAAFLTKLVGRFPIVAVTACIHLALLGWLIQWKPVPDGLIYCVIASIWGAVNGIWLLQINALNGILFPGNEEAAYSIFRFIECIGSIFAYAISPSLCMSVKLWFMIFLILIGTLGYAIVEYLWRKKRNLTVAPAPDRDDADFGIIQRTRF